MIAIIPKPQRVRLLSGKQYVYLPTEYQRYIEEGHGREGYRLLIDNDGVKMFSGTPEGFFRAETTLKQLLQNKKLPNVEITDYPQYEYRGYMLDCARHFFPVAVIKKQLQAMALLKMNYFHWHLTDDQGWRIESERYPLLTQVGSHRAQTKFDGKPVSGYYTKAEIKEVVDYAKSLFIEVVPEIDVPGHMSAALAAYPELSCDGEKIAVSERFGIHKNVLCAGKAEAVETVWKIIEETADLFPGKYFHLGGDEAPRDKWECCPDCQRLIKEKNLKNGDGLQAYLINIYAGRLETMGKTVINWNDGMRSNLISDSIVMQYWKQGRKDAAAAAEQAKNGRKMIFSPFFAYYLDYPYGMTSLKKTYCYSIGFKGIENKSYLLGVEAPLWTEYVPSEQKLEEQTYPRLAALAEKAWSNVTENQYLDFLNRLRQINKIFDQSGIKYATIDNANPDYIEGKKAVLKFFLHALRKKQK
jgi:hexosaminidase